MKKANDIIREKICTRDKIKSFKSKPSKHVKRVYSIYGIESMKINSELENKTGCSMSGLRKKYTKKDREHIIAVVKDLIKQRGG